MPNISIPLDTCLKCDSRRVEVGDEIKIALNPDSFSPGVIEDYSPVDGVVTEVRAPLSSESVNAAMVIEVDVELADLPPGTTTLPSSSILSVSCYDCCARNSDRITALEESSGDGIVVIENWSNVADDGAVPSYIPGEEGTLRANFFEATGAGFDGYSRITRASSTTGQTGSLLLGKASGFVELKANSITGSKLIQLPNNNGTVTLGDGSGITNSTAFRAALGLTSTAQLAQNRILETEPAVVDLTGGGSTKLDGIATVGLPTLTKRRVFVDGSEWVYNLRTGTDPENSPFIVRPDDYNGVTNAKVWELQPNVAVSANILDATDGFGGAPDELKVVLYGVGGGLNATSYLGVKTSAGIARIKSTNIGANQDYEVPTSSGILAVTTNLDGSMPVSLLVTSANSGSAGAGRLGQFIDSQILSGAAVSLVTATPKNITSIALTAGDWDVEGIISFNGTTSTITALVADTGITTNTLTLDPLTNIQSPLTTTTTTAHSLPLTRKRVALSVTTTIYLVAQATFSAGTVAGYGSISARRVR